MGSTPDSLPSLFSLSLSLSLSLFLLSLTHSVCLPPLSPLSLLSLPRSRVEGLWVQGVEVEMVRILGVGETLHVRSFWFACQRKLEVEGLKVWGAGLRRHLMVSSCDHHRDYSRDQSRDLSRDRVHLAR